MQGSGDAAPLQTQRFGFLLMNDLVRDAGGDSILIEVVPVAVDLKPAVGDTVPVLIHIVPLIIVDLMPLVLHDRAILVQVEAGQVHSTGS